MQKRTKKPGKKQKQRQHQAPATRTPKPKTQNLKPKTHHPKANLFGFHAVHEAWLNEDRHIKTLYATEAGLKTFDDILPKAKHLQRPTPTILEKDELEKCLPPGAVHQGLALIASDLPEISVQDFIIKAQNTPATLVMLDQVTDPHNIGAILRSACVLGLDGMIMQRKHSPLPDGVLAKTACGAVEHIPIAYETNLNRTLEDLKAAGFFIYGLDERGEDIETITRLPDKKVLVMGAEGPGAKTSRQRKL